MVDSSTYESNLHHPTTATANYSRFYQSIGINAAQHTAVHEAGRYIQLTTQCIVDPENSHDGVLNTLLILPANPTTAAIAL